MTDKLIVPEKLTKENEPPAGQVLIYKDGATHLQVRLDGDTVWLTQRLIAELFQTTVANINQHLSTIYEEKELRPEATIKKYLIVQSEGSRRVTRRKKMAKKEQNAVRVGGSQATGTDDEVN